MNRIRFLRRNHHPPLTQEELAACIGVTQDRISRIETGETLPSVNEALRLAILFNVRVREMFFDFTSENEAESDTS